MNSRESGIEQMDPLVGLTVSSIPGSSAPIGRQSRGDRLGEQLYRPQITRPPNYPPLHPYPPTPLRRPKPRSRPDNSPREHQVSGWREAWKGVGGSRLRGQEQLRPKPGPPWAPSLGVGREGRPLGPAPAEGTRRREPGGGDRGKCRPQPTQRARPAARSRSRTPAAHLVDSLQSHGGKRWRRPPGAGTGTGEGRGRGEGA